jgi:hypothetical protein
MADVSSLSEGSPTLSQLSIATFAHLEEFAALCDRICSKAEGALAQLAQKVRAPGGVEWEGVAGNAAIAQADADVVKVRPFLWGLPEAAAIARRGQDTLGAGQRLALDAVDDAERDGFEVNEDYSVTDTREATTREQYDQRQAAAHAHSSFIRHRVGTLVANDQHITAQLKEASSGWGNLTFTESAADLATPFQAVAGFRPDIPEHINVICIEHAKGMPWEFECLVHYPDGTTDIYNTDEDESGIFP